MLLKWKRNANTGIYESISNYYDAEAGQQKPQYSIKHIFTREHGKKVNYWELLINKKDLMLRRGTLQEAKYWAQLNENDEPHNHTEAAGGEWYRVSGF